MIGITILLENTTINAKLKPKHGLSIGINSGVSKILLDVGPDNTFHNNAKWLEYDISKVENLILSHSHSDHTGGLEEFININTSSKIFLFDNPKYAKYFVKIVGPVKIPVGLIYNKQTKDRIKSIVCNTKIDERTWFIMNTSTKYEKSKFNQNLYMYRNGEYVSDNFKHEGILVIDDGELVLFNSCSHNGIYNCIESVKTLFPNKKIRSYVGGLHFLDPITKKHVDNNELDKLYEYLENENIILFTGHCTGIYCIEYLEKKAGNRVIRIRTGSELLV